MESSLVEHGPSQHNSFAIVRMNVGNYVLFVIVRDVLTYFRRDNPIRPLQIHRSSQVHEAYITVRVFFHIARSVVTMIFNCWKESSDGMANLAYTCPQIGDRFAVLQHLLGQRCREAWVEWNVLVRNIIISVNLVFSLGHKLLFSFFVAPAAIRQ